MGHDLIVLKGSLLDLGDAFSFTVMACKSLCHDLNRSSAQRPLSLDISLTSNPMMHLNTGHGTISATLSRCALPSSLPSLLLSTETLVSFPPLHLSLRTTNAKTQKSQAFVRALSQYYRALVMKKVPFYLLLA